MMTFEECAKFAGIDLNELLTDSTFSAKHRSLLSSYLFNLKRGPSAVREMIVIDIRIAIDLGATKQAADLLLALRMFLSNHPEARIVQRTPRTKTLAYTTCRFTPDYRVTCIDAR